jgi:uncharacterized protein
MNVTLATLKRRAVHSSLFQPTTLTRAIERMGFVQADPIRSPARAQDLILRHRVKGYRMGDLEKKYSVSNIEEDFLYAYGFMPRRVWEILHPRQISRLTVSERRVLDLVTAHENIHPRQLEAHLGRKREINAWGGYSKATTHILQALHYRGLLRISGREKGIKLYQPVSQAIVPKAPEERLRALVLLIATILAPIPEQSLRFTLRQLAHSAPTLEGRKSIVTKLLQSGELESAVVDQLRYVWPAGLAFRNHSVSKVRFLAPFDPVVWDRRRFEHFWGWAYRFEAYTPVAKRKLGYYAMPLLWGEEVVGWVNLSYRMKRLTLQTGYIKKKPAGSAFKNAFDEEVERFRSFLQA